MMYGLLQKSYKNQNILQVFNLVKFEIKSYQKKGLTRSIKTKG